MNDATLVAGNSAGTSFTEPPDPFTRLPEIAARLGVAEAAGGDMGLILGTRDGRQYSLAALMSAFLDRMDGALSVISEQRARAERVEAELAKLKET